MTSTNKYIGLTVEGKFGAFDWIKDSDEVSYHMVEEWRKSTYIRFEVYAMVLLGGGGFDLLPVHYDGKIAAIDDGLTPVVWSVHAINQSDNGECAGEYETEADALAALPGIKAALESHGLVLTVTI